MEIIYVIVRLKNTTSAFYTINKIFFFGRSLLYFLSDYFFSLITIKVYFIRFEPYYSRTTPRPRGALFSPRQTPLQAILNMIKMMPWWKARVSFWRVFWDLKLIDTQMITEKKYKLRRNKWYRQQVPVEPPKIGWEHVLIPVSNPRRSFSTFPLCKPTIWKGVTQVWCRL